MDEGADEAFYLDKPVEFMPNKLAENEAQAVLSPRQRRNLRSTKKYIELAQSFNSSINHSRIESRERQP